MTKAYESFLSEPITYSLAKLGEDHAISFRGPRPEIDKAYNLFANLGLSRKLVWLRESPDPTSEHHAYMSCTLPRVKAAIKLYLYLRILMGHEVAVTEYWNEETGVYRLEQDEKAAERLAEADAMHFMASLQTESFIPSHRYAA